MAAEPTSPAQPPQLPTASSAPSSNVLETDATPFRGATHRRRNRKPPDNLDIDPASPSVGLAWPTPSRCSGAAGQRREPVVLVVASS